MIGITIIAIATALATISATYATRELLLLRDSNTQTALRTPFATLLTLRIVTAGLLMDALIHLIVHPNWHSLILLAAIGMAFAAHLSGNVARLLCIRLVAGKEKEVRLTKPMVIRATIFFALATAGYVALIMTVGDSVETIISGMVGITVFAALIGGDNNPGPGLDSADKEYRTNELALLHLLGKAARGEQKS